MLKRSQQLVTNVVCKNVGAVKRKLNSTMSFQGKCLYATHETELEQGKDVRSFTYNLSQFCWEGCHILPCFCFPPLLPFQCWISMDFSSAVLSGKHSTLKRGVGGPANRDRD